ncbi:hypothetical protein SAMN04487988_105189 [Algoriphagus hitonicola]|uniref:Uncharacterized protein n=1 Tax=Algoriphagus hitonicola TaxID=435880 RepID=A0A1I2TAF0_9BACT|nr:hypothetical protein SAMN04487988_105189 [Algoriphagus hitonicola]
MTGGAGFSRSSMQSFKDNHSLGKVRPQLKIEEKSRSGKNASKKDISLAFHLHQEQRQRSYLKKNVLSWLIFILLMAFLILLFFN